MDNSDPDQPEIIKIALEELLESPREIYIQEETQERHKAVDSIRIRIPESLSLDPYCNCIGIVEGFTPGATKNIINVDTAAFYVYSATQDQIKFESRTEFTSEIMSQVHQIESGISRLRLSFLQSSLFLIPGSLKHVIRMVVTKRVA